MTARTRIPRIAYGASSNRVSEDSMSADVSLIRVITIDISVTRGNHGLKHGACL